VLITKIEKLIKEYYKIFSIEIYVNMHLINSGENKKILCGGVYNLYPNKKVAKIRKLPLSVDSPYEIETSAYILLNINLKKLKDLQAVDYKKRHYTAFVIEILSKDVRYAFGIDPIIKEIIYERATNTVVNFNTSKNSTIQIVVPRPPIIHNIYKSIPETLDVKIVLIKRKTFIPYL